MMTCVRDGFLGTAAYIAPSRGRAEGREREQTARDIWAVSASWLFEMMMRADEECEG